MAAISITRDAVFSLSKTLSNNRSFFFKSTHKVSRVCFTSASKHKQGRNAAEDNKDDTLDYTDKAKQSIDGAKERAEEAKEWSHEMKEKTKERSEEMKDKAKGYTQETKESAKGMAQSASEKAKQGANKVAGTKKETEERAKRYADDVKEKTKDYADTTADKAAEGTSKVAETVGNIGEKAKRTVKGAWEATKGTTQKIKETVVGKDDANDVKKDEEVAETRRRTGSGGDDEVKVEKK